MDAGDPTDPGRDAPVAAPPEAVRQPVVASALKPSDGCVGCLAAALFAVVAAFLAMPGDLPALLQGQTPPVRLASVFAGQAGLLAGVALVVARSRVPWRQALAVSATPPSALLLAPVGLLGLSLVGDGLIAALRQVWPDLSSVLGEVAGLLQGLTGPRLWLVLAGFAVVPAVCEETLFRGLIFGAVRSRWSFLVAALVSAVLFGALHGDPLQTPAALLLGLYLAAIRERTGSLLPCVVAHAANNAIGVALMLQGAEAAASGATPLPLVGGLAVAVACLALLPGADR